ncbi:MULTISPECIES: DUF3313 domain-containing protein [unclassified Pseudomonas]|uniref:DUF3313 domain-containing protein n=1 Tax=unclassified Pseudomonas TaxID=196821 RepID=UPI001032BFC1|nr:MULTISPECIES: DUF3313 domain-containing protein [unclassified Pseudomonas]
MNTSRKLLFGMVLSSLLLGACTSKITSKTQYSGFLENYEDLHTVTTPSGEESLRWTSPSWDPDAYDTVVFQQLELFPSPKPNERVDQATLDQLQAYMSKITKKVLSQKYHLLANVDAVPANARALELRVAITGVSASNEGIKWYEVVPVAAVISGVGAATGHRDQNTELYLEAELIDMQTSQTVAKVVRKAFGEQLKNASQPITAQAFKGAIRALTNDLEVFLR